MRKFFQFILNFIELYLPMLTFVTLFGVFVLGIFFRYFLTPLTWTLELSLICFIWTALLGGLYAKRLNSHVKFSMVYDLFSPGGQRWIRMIGNALLLCSFILGFIPSLRYVIFMGFKKSNVLKIPMDVAFSPFVIFMTFMIGHFIYDLYNDVKTFFTAGDSSE